MKDNTVIPQKSIKTGVMIILTPFFSFWLWFYLDFGFYSDFF